MAPYEYINDYLRTCYDVCFSKHLPANRVLFEAKNYDYAIFYNPGDGKIAEELKRKLVERGVSNGITVETLTVM